MDYKNDDRVVMTLDAGGTNFVFTAIKGLEEITEPIRLPSNAHDLKLCLQTIVEGFTQLKSKLKQQPVAISFAFPGPADYPNGIIGDLGNLPAFRGGVALGPMLESKFGIPVFINNDGDLFVYGEAIAGLLPFVNQMLEKNESSKQYKNLFGVTLGTGFGAGFVRNGQLLIGDNSCGAEIWILRNKKYPKAFAEEGASIRAVRRVYAEKSSTAVDDTLTPKDVYDIAKGTKKGNAQAAQAAFAEMGEVVGDALANAITLFDALIVIGGGLTGAAEFILPAIVKEMNGKIETLKGEAIARLPLTVFNLEDETQITPFVKGKETKITIPNSEVQIAYDPMKRIGIGLSKLGTSKSVSIGAYAYALSELDS